MISSSPRLPLLLLLSSASSSYYYYYYSFKVFHISFSWWFFTVVLAIASLLKSPGLVSGFWPLLSNAVVWIVSTRPPTSKSSRPFNNPLVIVPNAPITTGTIVTFMFHSFFSSLARSRFLSLFSLSFRFILWSVDNFSDSLFFFFFFC